jgi:LCP family protein required for cell wall assembly
MYDRSPHMGQDHASPPGPRHRIQLRRERRRRLLRRLLIGANAFVLACLVAAGVAFYYAHYRYSQIHKVSVGNLQAAGAGDPTQPETILMVGNNTRCGLNGKQANAFGTCAEVGGGRSDVTMLVHLVPQTHRVTILSIPRDLWLPVPGTSNQLRVDDALNQGPGFLVQTIEQDLGIPIDHYVSLNFDTFQAVVDDLGGIQMYFPVPVKDAYSALNVPQAGCQHLNGFQALAVVRARHLYYFQGGSWHYDGNGDLSRIQRDHEFLRVLAAQVAHKGLSNPLTANAVIGSIAPHLQVDSGFSLSDMVSLVLTFRGVDPNSVPTYTLPVIVDPNFYYYKGYNYGNVVFPSQPADQQTIDEFLGNPPPGQAALSSTTVRIQSALGSSANSSLASQLAQYGLQVVSTGYAPLPGNPAETVITYAPGQLAAAQQLQAVLSGSVALAQGPTPPGVDLVLDVGTAVSVIPKQQPAGAAVPNPAGQPTPPQQPLPPYDPTACPASGAPPATQGALGAKH